jgi:hypothetical protein
MATTGEKTVSKILFAKIVELKLYWRIIQILCHHFQNAVKQILENPQRNNL